MALECLTILGIKNEPLFQCAPGRKTDDTISDTEDVFGFLESETGKSCLSIRQEVSSRDILSFPKRHLVLLMSLPCSFILPRKNNYQFMMHAALDRLEEILGSPKSHDIVKMQRGTKWMGSLLPMEEFEIYGYVTTSNVKILALIKRDSVIPLEKRKDSNIKNLFVSYVDSLCGGIPCPFQCTCSLCPTGLLILGKCP